MNDRWPITYCEQVRNYNRTIVIQSRPIRSVRIAAGFRSLGPTLPQKASLLGVATLNHINHVFPLSPDNVGLFSTPTTTVARAPSVRHVTMQVLQQFSGINVVLYYTPQILDQVGPERRVHVHPHQRPDHAADAAHHRRGDASHGLAGAAEAGGCCCGRSRC